LIWWLRRLRHSAATVPEPEPPELHQRDPECTKKKKVPRISISVVSVSRGACSAETENPPVTSSGPGGSGPRCDANDRDQHRNRNTPVSMATRPQLRGWVVPPRSHAHAITGFYTARNSPVPLSAKPLLPGPTTAGAGPARSRCKHCIQCTT
jgi:hypothetical protein